MRGRTYTQTDVYGNYEYYMHGLMRIGKRANTKVKNYDLRDLDKETNMKNLMLPLDMCRWLVEGEDAEVVHEVLVRHHRYLTSHRLLISKPLLRQ